MEIEDQGRSEIKPKWLSVVGLLIILYFMYSSTFLSDYLMNDERGLIGKGTPDFFTAMASSYFKYGRALYGLYQKLVFDFMGYDTWRIQFIRFIAFASITTIAALLLKFQEGRLKNRYLAFFAILFFLSQLPIQVIMGYSLQLICGSQPTIWLSLLAFYLFFFVFDHSRFPKLLQAGVVFVILILAMQSTQTYAFFATIPLASLALCDWKNRKGRIIEFLLIAVAVFVFSTIAFKANSDIQTAEGGDVYGRGEQGLEYLFYNPMNVFLIALNPRTYWSAFKFWAFPFPLQNTPPLSNLLEKIASILIMIIWLVMIFASLWVEIKRSTKEDRREIVFKWIAVAFCFGLAATFIIADSPFEIIDHRPHMLLTFSGLVIFTGAYALDVLTSRFTFLRSRSFKVLMSIVVLMAAFGAQAGVLRNIVGVHAKQLDFMRSELLAGDPNSYSTVIVVLPRWNGCVTEPCGPWIGWSTDEIWHMSRPGAYRYALATIGADPSEKEIVFANKMPDHIPQDAVTIDWNIYSSAQQRYAEHFIP